MKFVGGARFRSGRIVIRPSRRISQPDTGIVDWTKPLRAEFRDHMFDSDKAAQELDWTDEEKNAVEQALIKHPAMNRVDGTGIYLANAATRPIREGEIEVVPTEEVAPVERCLHFDDIDDVDEPVQCELPASPDSPNQLCKKHERQLAGKA